MQVSKVLEDRLSNSTYFTTESPGVTGDSAQKIMFTTPTAAILQRHHGAPLGVLELCTHRKK